MISEQLHLTTLPSRHAKWAIDWLSPIPLFLLISIFGVLLPIGPFLRSEDGFSLSWPFPFYDKESAVATAVALYAAAAAAFVAGARIGSKARRPRAQKFELRAKGGIDFSNTAILFVLFGLAVFGATYYMVGGISGFLTGASDRTRAFAGIQFLFILMNVLFSLAFIWFIRIVSMKTDLAEKTIFSLYVIFAIGISSLQGQKSTLFICIATMAVIYNVRHRRLGFPLLSTGIVAVFLALMAYHVLKQEYFVVGRVVSVSVGKDFFASAWDFLSIQLSGNFMQLQTMAVLVDGVPGLLPYQYGYTYYAGLLLLVPRAIFPDKPLPSSGILTEAFWPQSWQDFGTTLPPGFFGEAYLNFGAAGVVAAGLLGGAVLGSLHRRVIDYPQDDRHLINYAIMVAALLHFFRGELASVLILVLSMALPCRLFLARVPARAEFR